MDKARKREILQAYKEEKRPVGIFAIVRDRLLQPLWLHRHGDVEPHADLRNQRGRFCDRRSPGRRNSHGRRNRPATYRSADRS